MPLIIADRRSRSAASADKGWVGPGSTTLRAQGWSRQPPDWHPQARCGFVWGVTGTGRLSRLREEDVAYETADVAPAGAWSTLRLTTPAKHGTCELWRIGFSTEPLQRTRTRQNQCNPQRELSQDHDRVVLDSSVPTSHSDKLNNASDRIQVERHGWKSGYSTCRASQAAILSKWAREGFPDFIGRAASPLNEMYT
ncbi:hypothetical protein SCAR479_01955 [Seiridium cardinale]|uniref:Uncharacterized protein n=1 Tax=Seiridium cardinale TaxID=138064 RepID=A0ABR2Y480_9PEZI